MSSSKAYLTWALNQEGDLVHVDEVPNGNECGCVCPHCKSRITGRFFDPLKMTMTDVIIMNGIKTL